MSKLDAIKENGTSGPNYDVSTEDVIKKLKQWDSQFGIEISEVSHDHVLVEFNSIPDNLKSFAKEVYDFCPDVIDQHFGCMDEMVEMMEETGQEIAPEIADLIEGVDLEDEGFGEVLLQKSIKATQSVSLWWD